MDQPIIFEETSQKIYSFEGFVLYGLKHWLEASDIITSEVFWQWLQETLGLKKEYEALKELLKKKLTDCQKLLLFLEGAPSINEEDLLQMKHEIRFWEDQPLQYQMKSRGDLAFQDKRFSHAVKFYRLAQKEFFDPIVEHNIGASYMHLNFFVEAEQALHAALKHSDQLEIHLSLIRLLKITNRTNEAIARVKDLMVRYDQWEVHFECGTIYHIKQQYQKAYEAFTWAYAHDQQVIILVHQIETSMSFQTCDETLSLIEQLKDRSPEDYYILKARLLVRKNKADEALECLEDGLSLLEASKAIALELSKVCRIKKQIIKAINAVMKAQINGADQDEVLYEMALIAKRAGNRKDYEGKIDELKSFWKSSLRSKYTQ